VSEQRQVTHTLRREVILKKITYWMTFILLVETLGVEPIALIRFGIHGHSLGEIVRVGGYMLLVDVAWLGLIVLVNVLVRKFCKSI